MTTLEQAARQALEALENRFNPKGFGEMDRVIDTLRQALERPKQEPMLWGCKFNKGNRLDTFYTKGAAERFVEGSLRNGADVSLVGLYTEPPKREWIGLTDEQVEDLYFDNFSMSELEGYARAIEAKLKELNNT